MATRSFAAQLKGIADKTKTQMKDVLGASVEDVMKIAQTPVENGGRMPVKDGYLVNSVVSELNGEIVGPASTESDKGGAQSTANIALVVTDIEPGDTARFGWTAEYARRMEMGFVGEDSLGRTFNQEGKHFVEGAAAQWPQIVERNVGRLK